MFTFHIDNPYQQTLYGRLHPLSLYAEAQR
jgi:hypothetical protein